MTEEQLAYVLHPLDQKSYLKACPGSGKTEAVALKAAYALRAHTWKHTGVAFLSFTNHAANVIQERVARLSSSVYPHYFGTFNSWLHGYILNPFGWRIMKYNGKGGDCSVRIVDAASEALFLNSFRTKYAYAQTGNVYAHEFFIESDRIIFSSDDDAKDAARNAVVLADWQQNDLMDAKARFWRAGFANHQDVETICSLVLKDLPTVRNQVAQRFPTIVIDECQDLCPSQLALLGELRASGVNVHLVGDLNQSIFSFRGSDPVVILKHIADEQLAELAFSVNFRSVQAIIDVCGKIVAHGAIQGRQPIPAKPACVYFPYSGKADLPQLAAKFEQWLVEHRDLDPANCAVIARGSSTLQKLRGLQAAVPRTVAQRVATSLHDWQRGDLQSRQSALKHFGAAVAGTYFSGESADSSAYSRPESVSSAIGWRIFLASTLDACRGVGALVDFTQTWTAWTAVARQHIPGLIAAAWPHRLPNYALRMANPMRPFPSCLASGSQLR